MLKSVVVWPIVALTGVIVAVTAASAMEYKTEQREAVHHVFPNDKALDVDNVNGLVSVIGDSESTIRVDGEKIIKGADQSEVDRGKREVTLDINEKEGVAQLYVNGPFRDRDHGSENHGYHDNGSRHYEVIYNLTIHVPRATALTLRDVNGEVKDENTSGKFDVHGVNGGIVMSNIAGSGSIATVNGSVQVAFRENPVADTSFRSVNGRIDVTLQQNLSANLKMATVNGAAFTNFDLTSVGQAAQQQAAQQKDGRFVYRGHRLQNFRAGSGGPELAFQTVNGDIHIQKQVR